VGNEKKGPIGGENVQSPRDKGNCRRIGNAKRECMKKIAESSEFTKKKGKTRKKSMKLKVDRKQRVLATGQRPN